MSGQFISSRLLTNNGLKELDINDYLNSKIKDISIHVIPLPIEKTFSTFQMIGSYIKIFTPMIINPISLTHVAIQLNLEISEDILIIEYGNYLTQDNNLKKSQILSSNSSNSSNEPRKNENENIYYYINKNGARITIFSSEKLKKIDKNGYYSNNISDLISYLIASQYYNISHEEFRTIKYKIWEMNNSFVNVDCDIKKKSQ